MKLTPQEQRERGRLYYVWKYMRNRCNNKRNNRYHRYGKRGISICGRWDSFDTFLADMGPRPDGYSLDRIDNNGNYAPDNCRWASNITQSNNRSTNVLLTLQDRTMTIAEWSAELNIEYDTLKTRVYYGWNHERILTTP